ncbi:MAG: AAA family ATPase, partial [Microbacterium sp.]
MPVAAARGSHGTLDGDLKGAPFTTIYVGHEDDPERVWRPRLEAAGADLDKVFKLGIIASEEGAEFATAPNLASDLLLIRDAIEKTDAKLVIVDPLTSVTPGDLNKVETVRKVLDPLLALSQDLDIAIVGIMHFNKGAGRASDKLSGSHAFRDAARSVLLFATDDDSGRRVITVDKSNYTQSAGESFAFDLESVAVHLDDGGTAE